MALRHRGGDGRARRGFLLNWPGRRRDAITGSFLASRPPRWPSAGPSRRWSRPPRPPAARAHIVHLSAAECVAILGRVKAAGVALTAETCPHYLFFAAEEVPAGGTEFKCCPPIRDAVNREALWRGLEAGVIDCVVSDHSPCLPELKRRGTPGTSARPGAASRRCRSGSPAVWTAARRRGRTLADVTRWMSAGAGRAGPPGWPGPRSRSAATRTWSPSTPTRRSPSRRRRPAAPAARVTPYEGRTLACEVHQTWLRGPSGDRPGCAAAQPPAPRRGRAGGGD